MEKKPMSLHMGKKKTSKAPCPVCDEELYYDNDTTQRVGLLADDYYSLEGWMCPHCTSRFDMDDNLMGVSPINIKIGRA